MVRFNLVNSIYKETCVKKKKVVFILNKGGVICLNKTLENKNMFIENIWLIVEYSLTMSITNVAIER